MSDPTLLLLLTCANCLETAANTVETDVETCKRTSSTNCVVPPDAIAFATTPSNAGQTPLPEFFSANATLPTPPTQQESEKRKPQAQPTSSSSAKLRLGSKGEAVRKLQVQLQQLGRYSGPIDGVYGPLTQAAVSQFQDANGLAADGVAGDRTWGKLRQSTVNSQQSTDGEKGEKETGGRGDGETSQSSVNSQQSTAPDGGGVGSRESGVGENGKTGERADNSVKTSQPSPENNSTAQTQKENSSFSLLPSSFPISLLGWIAFLAAGIGVVAMLKKYGYLEQWQVQMQTGVATLETAASKLGEPMEGTFDRPVMLQQSSKLPKAIAWTIIGIAVFGLAWASLAKIEQVVPAEGQLKPQGTVKEVQAPVGGVVTKVHVEDGQRVQAGDLLVSFDATNANADLVSLQKVRESLLAETNFYRTLMSQTASPAETQAELQRLKLPGEVVLLTQNRVALVAQNKLYRAQLRGNTGGENLDADEQAWLAIAKAEFQSRTSAARLAVSQLEQQLRQNQSQLANARAGLATDARILRRIENRNIEAVTNARKSLDIDKKILSRIDPLVKEGAVARIQYERQLQQVTDRQDTLLDKRSQGTIDFNRQLQEVKNRRAEIAQLIAEQRRLTFDIDQSRAELYNTSATAQKDVLDQIAANKQQIADIDSQLTKILLENKKRLAEMDGKIQQSKLTLEYQELRAPVAGTVFDLQSKNPGFVAQPSEALVKIVPDENLIAEVFITNEDIGFVREEMEADVRIQSFPFSEFGQITGEVISIGSDALPPDELHPFYRFPAKVKLSEQNLDINDREIPLQSGMSVNVNIKIREDRRVISLLTDLFTKKIESLEEVR